MNKLGWNKHQRTHFITLFLLFLLHQFLEKIALIKLPIVDDYLDPLLCMPFLLSMLLMKHRCLIYKDKHYILPPFLIITATLLISIIAEGIFPMIQPKFVADIWDIICYILGAIYFQLFFNHSL